MNAKNRSVAQIGVVFGSVLALAATGCRTQTVHHTRTVYVPAPAPVVYAPPPPAPQPPPVVVVQSTAPAPVVVIQAESDFYEPLGTYGRWEVVAGYGRCWIPGRVEAGWRPYSDGYWQRTDAGWYWVSAEPWGWATYHYGRWDWHARFGWFWVPQTQWAPAWVCWREGGGYVGWAPLRPSVTIGVNIHVGDYEPAHASRAFVFVEHRRMLEPVRPRTVIVNNTTIINKTVNITKIKVVNKTVINEGPQPEVIERESGRKVRAVPAHEFRQQEETTVAARERNVPTAKGRNAQPAGRVDTQAAEATVVAPRNTQAGEATQVVAKPAEAVPPPARPAATHGRPIQVQKETEELPRTESQRQAEAARKVAAPAVVPVTETKAQPEQVAIPRREVRPVEKPVVTEKPAPRVVTAKPVRDEKKMGAAAERNVAPASVAVEPRSRNEARPETKHETKPAMKVESAPPVVTNRQVPAPANGRVQKPEAASKAKVQSPKQAEASKQKQVKQNKKADGSETNNPTADSPPRHR